MSDRPKCYDNEGGVIAMLEGLNTCGDVCCVGGVCNPDTKLCYSAKLGLYRGGCSDQTWGSGDCSQICPWISYSDEFELEGYPITGAKLTECSDGTYCCGPFNDPNNYAEKCCENGLGFLIDARGNEVSKPTSTTSPLTPSNTKAQSTTQATTETTRTADSATDSTEDIGLLSTASSFTTKATPSASPSKSASALNDMAATASTPASSSTPPSDSSSGLSTGARIGLGVGSAVAVIAICVALFFFYRERKLRKREALKHQSFVFLPDPQEDYRYETRVELAGDPMRMELEGDAVRAELPAGEVEQKIN